MKDFENEENISEETPAENKVEVEERQTGKSRRLYYILGGIALLSLLIGTGWWLYSRRFVSTQDALIQGNITFVVPKISANVEKVFVKENQFVRKGDLLIELDSRELRAKLEQAEAELKITLAKYEKARAVRNLTQSKGGAALNQAGSSVDTAKNEIARSRIASSLKEGDLQSARSQITSAEANLRRIQAQIPEAEAEIAKSQALVTSAKNKVEVAEIEYKRDLDLERKGYVSKQKLGQSNKEFIEAEANLVSAEKQVDISKARLNSLRRLIDFEKAQINERKINAANAEKDLQKSKVEVDLSRSKADESLGKFEEADSLSELLQVDSADISTSEAEILKAKADVAEAEIALGYSRIYAPQDGYISKKAVNEGQMVQPDQVLMAVTLPGIWVVGNYKETELEKIRVGQTVDIYVDAYPNAGFKGKVESIQAGTGSRFSIIPTENASGNFIKVVQRVPVKIVFDKPPDTEKYMLVPGMSVVPRIHVR